MAARKKAPAKKTKTTAAKNRAGAPLNNKNAVGNKGGGRPSVYAGEKHCRIAREMTKLGAPDRMIAIALGVGVTTFHRWRHEHVEFSEACQMGRDVLDKELVRTAAQRALGYSFDSEKLFAPAGSREVLRAATVEHVPPDTGMLKWLLQNHLPDIYRDTKEHKHTIDEVLRAALEDMSEQSKLERAERARVVNAKVIEHQPA